MCFDAVGAKGANAAFLTGEPNGGELYSLTPGVSDNLPIISK